MLAAQSFTIGSGAITHFGNGELARLVPVLTKLETRRVFLVSDPGVRAAGIVAEVIGPLHTAGLEVAIFDDVHMNPSVGDLDRGALAIRMFGHSTVVALGGGAVMDTAKCLALMATNAGGTRDFDYRLPQAARGLPVVAVPTTAGTGSETNAWGVIDDREAGRKFYVGHESVAPRAIILDPALTLGLRPSATAASGMDALVHALESLASRNTNPYSRCLALAAVQLVGASLERVVSDGSDLEARSQMLLAAHFAGLAFATTGLGLCHALGHAISARTGASHGAALTAVLPHVMEYNLPVSLGAHTSVGEALGVPTYRPGGLQEGRAAIDAVVRLGKAAGLPDNIGALGCTLDLLPAIADDALADEVLANNPRQPTRGDVMNLLLLALDGDRTAREVEGGRQ
jgi:alcohol dehydrogenase class IV